MAVFATVRRGALEPARRPVPDDDRDRRAPRRWERSYVLVLVLLDFVAALVGSVTALLLRFGPEPTTDPTTATYFWVTLGLPVAWVLLMTAARAYQPRYLGIGSEEFRRVATAAVWLTAIVGTCSWATKAEIARGYVVLALPLSCGLTLVARYAARKRLHARRARGGCMQRAIAVGHPGSVADLVRQVRREQYHGLQVIGACVPEGPRLDHDLPRPGRGPGRDTDLADLGVPVLGGFGEVLDAVHRVDADAVAVLACPEMDGRALRGLGWELEQTHADLIVAPALLDVAGPRIAIRPANGLPLLHVEEPDFTGGRRVAKGLFDWCVALAALTVLAPFLLAIAVAIRVTSPGPAFFRQTRVGRHGREFTMLKFRTMRADAERRLVEVGHLNEKADGLLFKIRDDPRVTRLGARLRRYSLDELPQLFNVLLGQMSLVGPRPPLPTEVAQYNDEMRRRLLVKPGLTGLWQISGRSDLSWEESVRLDLRYVENWSLALDAMILWKTTFAVFKKSGAY